MVALRQPAIACMHRYVESLHFRLIALGDSVGGLFDM